MKWTVQWLTKAENRLFDFSEEMIFPKETIEQIKQLRNLYPIKVNGRGRYDSRASELYVDLVIDGIMVVPCARTLDDVEYPFHIESTEIFAFHKIDEDQELRLVKGTIVDLMPTIFELIISEIPMRVIKEDVDFKSEGKHWRVIDSDDITEEDHIDPRLAKLKELFKEDK